MTMSDNAWENGLKVFDAVYGEGFSGMMKGRENDRFNREIIENQFGNLWADDALSIREKRLMVLGATTMLGRQDLIEIQMMGALANDEFTEEELALIPHFMLFYAGAGNCTALIRGIEAAKARFAELKGG
ncbi:MAG: hypothetical protein CL820_18715 [Croceicoccus sp.]|nr:hypothetical protein [Croceicoccus sp.]MAL27874.1 hypothetical protein [Croceicoccus sp.]|tara:strand:- start:8618 stop:9007 length:390 start_codon:yes stop_codon:yes gene_type:complete